MAMGWTAVRVVIVAPTAVTPGASTITPATFS
jgi:hypothetical protein